MFHIRQFTVFPVAATGWMLDYKCSGECARNVAETKLQAEGKVPLVVAPFSKGGDACLKGRSEAFVPFFKG